MEQKKVFYRRTVPFGNSAGVLLPKALLGADVKITLVYPPINIKRDVTRILEARLEDILGIYLIEKKEKEIEILAVSTNINDELEKGRYKIKLIPFQTLKKLTKENTKIKEKIKQAKTIINKKLLSEIKNFS